VLPQAVRRAVTVLARVDEHMVSGNRTHDRSIEQELTKLHFVHEKTVWTRRFRFE
jgi:hypothetical protein